MATAKNVLDVAKAELDLGISGRPNKYTRWYGSISGYPDKGYGYPWCAAFLSWVMAKAGVPESVVPKSAAAEAFGEFAGKKNRLHDGDFIPKPMDIFLRHDGGREPWGHVGLVLEVKDGKFTTIEGNSSNAVRSNTFTIGSGKRYTHIFRPEYNDGSQTTKKLPPETGTISGVPYGQDAPKVFKNKRYKEYKDLFEKWGKTYDVDPNLLAAIAMQESTMGSDSANKGAAIGIMQVENTLLDPNEGYPNGWLSFASYGRKKYGSAWADKDRYDNAKSIEYAAYVLSMGFKHYNGDLFKTIQQYNYSHYSVDALIKKYGDKWMTEGRANHKGGDKKYVEKVLGYWRPQNLNGKYPEQESYLYGENQYEENEGKVVWNDRRAEPVSPALMRLSSISNEGIFRAVCSGTDITPYLGEISWSNSIAELSTSVEFSLAKSGDTAYIKGLMAEPGPGDSIQLAAGPEFFRGVIISVNDAEQYKNSYTAVDMGWYLNKTKQTYQFKNIRADDALRQICADLSIPVSLLPDLPVLIKQIYFDQAISEIIKDILSRCGGGFNFDFVPDGIRIYKIGDIAAAPVFRLSGNTAEVDSVKAAGGYGHSMSMEELITSVKVTSEKDSVYMELYVLQDRDAMNQYGFLQEIIKIDPEKQDPVTEAQRIFSENGKMKESMSLTILEDITSYTRAGAVIRLEDGNLYQINGTRHSVKDGRHYNEMELERM